MIPKKLLFANNDDYKNVQLSSDGCHLTYLKQVDQTLSLFIVSIKEIDNERRLAELKDYNISNYFWSFNNKNIIIEADENGNEEWVLFVIDVESGESEKVVSYKGIMCRVGELSSKKPDEIIVSLNKRDPNYNDFYNLNLKTKKLSLVQKNINFADIFFDDYFNPKLAYLYNEEGGIDYFINKENQFEKLFTISSEDAMSGGFLDFSLKDSETLYLLDSQGVDKAQVVEYNTSNLCRTVLLSSDKADIKKVIFHPKTKVIQAAVYEYLRKELIFCDNEFKEQYNDLLSVCDGEVDIVSRSLDDEVWLISNSFDNKPPTWSIYNTKIKKNKKLFSYKKELDKFDLSKMYSFIVKSQDGLDLTVYLSLPKGLNPYKLSHHLPTVLLVHGGPWIRDYWGYYPWALFLASRGYAVLSVNFRGSSGFGKKFLNAGNNEWGGKMLDDLVQTSEWAIEKGISDSTKIAIMGGSFGGYAALASLAFYPEFYSCGIDICGQSNLFTFLETIPPDWEPYRHLLYDRIANPNTEQGKKILRSHSPFFYADSIEKPLLIAHGANDPRVKKDESDQIVSVLKKSSSPVTYAFYPDEGHYFSDTKNLLSCMSLVEEFLAEHLGGSKEDNSSYYSDSSLELL